MKQFNKQQGYVIQCDKDFYPCIDLQTMITLLTELMKEDIPCEVKKLELYKND